MPNGVIPMSQSDAQLVVRQESHGVIVLGEVIMDKDGKCILRCVLSVALKQRCHSSLAKAGLFIAAVAITK
jgi:hypothetical protein